MRKRVLSFAAAAALFALLIVYSSAARAGAFQGLRLWGELLVPSLLPYFAAAGLMTRLGLADALGSCLSPVLGRAFAVSPAGCGVFLLGLSGGYPLGASAAAEAVRAGRLDKAEAERLLRFCDNTGPAFAVGAVGAGIFDSAVWGLLLWGIHALSAALLGLLARSGARPAADRRAQIPAGGPAPAAALTAAVSAAVTALLSIGGYVIFFSALLAVTGELGFPDGAAEALSRLTGGEAVLFRAALSGALELAAGIGAMAGLPLTPGNLALASFLLGWGGLCVHLQTIAVTAGTGIQTTGRLGGKLLHGVLSALITYFAAVLLL